MRYSSDPRQVLMFDSYERVLGPKLYRSLVEGWHGVMRQVVLELMPVIKRGYKKGHCIIYKIVIAEPNGAL